ncbi:MAG TPA: poly-gamma-glutamate biosynthesis protein PgsC/CapC [Desulfobacteraceae bacterium]|nr:poly-gamma-glutamate biosynthesis protein PgsC/CapC [Desulfobacteraceae bacterium]
MTPSLMVSIFPPGSLANSVTTTVWIGVCVTCFFNLRLGWVLSGMVVPGYLVPLIIIKPISAAVIVLEAMVTYGLVWFYSEYLSSRGLWNNFFGRDRFFALLIVSVLVRLVFDTILLPVSAEYVTGMLGISFDYRNNLHSFGLIVVALLANQLWKPGLKKGIIPVGVTILSTYLIVRYLLMGFTNFNMGNIVYMYEDIAASMLSSPKAYIILLTTSVLASRMNLRYGWDYSGILIPSLLALQWYQPIKLVYTFAETFVILLFASMVLRLPFFQEANMEGSRKTLLFFNIGFVYKLLLGWLLVWFFPAHKVTDYYGFGYLLTTLLAIKMHDKNIAVLITRASLQTSLGAVVAASIIGFGLTFVPNMVAISTPPPPAFQEPARDTADMDLMTLLTADAVNLFSSLKKNSYVSPLPREKEIFMEAVKAAEQCVRRHGKTAGQWHESPGNNSLLNSDTFHRAQKLFRLIHYELVPVMKGHPYLYAHEKEPQKGWGSYVFNLDFENSMMVQVPAPLDERGSLESGAWIFTSLKSRTLAIGGAGLKTNDNGAANILQQPSSIFSIFQRQAIHDGILQVRTHTAKTIRRLTGQRSLPSLGDPPVVDSILRVKSTLPRGFDLPFLKKNLDRFHMEWKLSPFKNRLAETAGPEFAELILNRRDARNLKMLKMPFSDVDVSFQPREQSIVGYLQDWLLRGKEQIAPKGSNRYQVPSPEALLYFDHEILTPLLKISRELYSGNGWEPQAARELEAVNAAASVLGYEVIRYSHQTSNQDYLILSERDTAGPKRYWGRYVFRMGSSNPYTVQIPRPLSEINVFEYGVALFEQIHASALMISTVHPLANHDGSSDLIQMKNKASLYTLVNQVVTREKGDDPMMAVQCRGLGFNPDAPLVDIDILLAFRSGVKIFHSLSLLKQRLVSTLQQDGFRVRLVDGSKETAGYEVGGIPQAMYLDHSVNKEFTIAWLPPETRSRYRQQTRNTIHENQFLQLGITTVEKDLHREITRSGKGRFDFSTRYRKTMEAYLENHDIITLDHLMRQWPKLAYQRVIDLNSKQGFLLIYSSPDRLAGVVNLVPKEPSTRMAVEKKALNPSKISDYIATRTAWLEWRKK